MVPKEVPKMVSRWVPTFCFFASLCDAEGGFMQAFYLSRNQHGYFRVRFPDPVTGKLGKAKSTHTKNRQQATLIADEWYRNGPPAGRSCERTFSEVTAGVDLVSLVQRLSPSEAVELSKLLVERFGNSGFVLDEVKTLKPTSDFVRTDESECVESVEVASAANDDTAEDCEDVVEISEACENAAPVVTNDCKSVVCESSVDAGSVDLKAVDKNVSCDLVSCPEQKASCGVKLVEYLFKFWDFENSEYIKRRQLRGFEIKQRNCKEKTGIVRRYWATYFDSERTVQSLTSRELDEFLLSLRRDKGLSADTVNKTMTAGNMAFEFLIKEGLLDKNPLLGVERFRVQHKKRGIPTETEMKQLMDLDWDWADPVYKLAFKVSALFGLRAGEISGLQVCDVDPVADLLYIRHSWNDTDKLKETKNGDDRTIPIEHGVALELLNNARRNPNYSDTSFVFWSHKIYDQPMWPSSFDDDFYIAMQKIGISEEQRKERNIVFHSLRHYCATQIAQRASLEIAMKILGHRTEEMTRLYSEHETQLKLNNAKEVLSQGWNVLIAA